MSRYNPEAHRQLRDEAHPSEIAGHRPMMAPRIVNEVSREEGEFPQLPRDLMMENDPLHSLRGQPDVLYEDESYHEEMNSDRFNRELRAGHGFRNEDDPDETGHY